MGRRRRRASPLDVDDLLAEILLRLPALPTSLPWASLVCTRWRRLVTDPIFLRSFRARHWEPVGVFHTSFQSGREHLSFSFISDQPPGSILHDRFSVPARCQDAGGGDDDYTWKVRGCRHGRVLLINTPRYDRNVHQLLVWNPLSGEQHLLGVPHFFDPDRDRAKLSNMQAAVIGDKGPFKVALAWNDGHSANACVYSSETGVWGDVVSAAVQPTFGSLSVGSLSVLVGNSLYWMLFGSYNCILEFDLGSQKLAVIELPPNAYANHRGIYLTTLAAGGGLSLLIMSPNLRAQLWERTTTSDDGVDRWMLGRTIELDKLLSLRPLGFQEYRSVLGLVGDDNVMFVSTYRGVFMVHLKLMQFEKVFETNSFCYSGTVRPFMNLYAPTCIYIASILPKAYFFSYNYFVQYCKSFNVGLRIEAQIMYWLDKVQLGVLTSTHDCGILLLLSKFSIVLILLSFLAAHLNLEMMQRLSSSCDLALC